MGVDLGFQFNANEVEPTEEYKPIPAGEYIAAMTNSERKTSQAGSDYVSCEFTVLEGEHEKRKLWANLNFWHDNDRAREMAHREFSAMCRATGQMNVGSTDPLHDQPIRIKVAVTKRKDTDEPQNVIRAYSPATAQPAGQGVSSSNGTNSGDKAPWDR